SAAGALFLERLAGPRNLETIRQRLCRDLFDRSECFARADTFATGAVEASSDITVEALEQLGTHDLIDLDQRLERDHLSARIRAHVDPAEIVGIVAEGRFRLHL